MGNLFSSDLNKKEEKLNSDNKNLQAAVEELKDENVLSKESVKKLKREVTTQKKTIELLKKAAKEMEDDNVCAKTKQELESVIEENNDLEADLKTANEKHRLQVETVTNEKMEAMKQLEKEVKKSEANGKARTENELREARRQTQTCLDNEKKLKKSEAKSKSVRMKLSRERSRLIMNVNDRKEFPDYPELVVAIRIGHVRDAYLYHRRDEDQLVVLDENPPCPELEVNADIFKQIIKYVPPPPFITAVGISAVTDEFMMTLWSEIGAGQDSNGLDGNSYTGMWRRFNDGEWNAVGDQSFMFGWKGYNG